MLDGHLQPLCTIGVDGSLSSDSFRAGQMSATAELGQQETSSAWCVVKWKSYFLGAMSLLFAPTTPGLVRQNNFQNCL
jgi:hypothetical protein